MKRLLQITALALLVAVGSAWQNQASAQPGGYDDYGGYGDEEVSYQTFYDELSPYGRWVDYPEYGYVWVPNGINNFRPYETGGHWVWADDYEWMWVSDYSWGWAPFHYGRWFQDPYYGWMWMPGYEWAPAWVAWRDGGDYYGWAPLRPGFNLSINISIGSYNPPVDYWCFAPRRYISSPRIYDYCLDRGRNVTIINNTTIINNYGRRNNVFYNGPRRMDAERYAGRINPVRFRESSRPGRSQIRNNEVSIFRPRVSRNNERQYTPRNFDRYDRNGNTAGRRNVFDRPNNEVRSRDNNDRNDRAQRRNVFDRPNNEVGTRGNSDRNERAERRNVFDRPNGEVRTRDNNPGADRPQRNRDVIERRTPDNRPQANERQERRNVFDRRNDAGSQPGGNRQERRFEQRNVETRPAPSQPERRNVFDRSNTPSQPRASGGESRRFERSSAPREQQPRFENRGGGGNQPQRGGGNENRGGRGRRN